MKVERRNTKESGGKEHKAGSCATEWAQQSQRRTADSKSAAVKDSLRHRRLHCAGGGMAASAGTLQDASGPYSI